MSEHTRLSESQSKIATGREICKGRSRYKDVRVLPRWEEGSLGVQYELEDLAKTFKPTYGFETETW